MSAQLDNLVAVLGSITGVVQVFSDGKLFTQMADQRQIHAVPYIEVANKTMPEDIDTANMLIKLYTQTGAYEKAKELKAKYQ